MEAKDKNTGKKDDCCGNCKDGKPCTTDIKKQFAVKENQAKNGTIIRK